MADIKLLTVIWKQNSPYGGYVSGDVVITYYDTTTKQFKVTKNAATITSGNQIPQSFYILGSTPDTYYKSEFTEQILICEGSSKVKYSRISTFPYLSKTLLTNHPSCDIPVVCDIKFTGLPSVTSASTDTSLDGSITVTASSSHGAIQYKLSDFTYGSGQTSGTFSNLRTGTYTIYARDAVNCRATITVKVDVSVSYGVLYQLEYQSADGTQHTAEVLEKGYSGAITEITAGTSPVRYRLRGESEREKFVSILPGEIEIAWVSQTEGEFAALYDNDPDQYRIRLTVDSQVKWIGKVLTNQIQERYVNPPYTFQAVATDGLAGLSEIPFVDDFGAKLTGELKQISVIAYILKKIGLGLNIRSACNIYATGMSTGTANDPLDQAYVDIDRYYLINDNPTCFDVLKYILEPYAAQIIQWDNKWNIIRVEERIGTFSYREYNSSGTYVSNSSYAPIKDIKIGTDTNRLVWKDQNQMLRIMPGYGSIRLINNLGRKDNIIKNGEFKLVAAPKAEGYLDDADVDYVVDTTGWQIVNAANTPINVRYQTIEQDNVALVLSSYEDNSLNYIISDDIDLKMGTTDRVMFKMRYKIQRSYEESNTVYNFYYLRVRFEVSYGGYWLNQDGQWVDTKTQIVTHLTNDQANQWIDFELNVGVPLNANGQPSVDFINGKAFNVKIYLPNANEAEYNESTTAAAVAALRTKQTVGYPLDTKASFFDIDGTYTPSGYAGVYLFYYNLKEDSSAHNPPNIIRPNDYSDTGATPNKKVWVLQHIQQYLITVKTFISLDYVSLEVLSNGEKNPENEALEQSMENRNRLPIQKDIYHSSIVNNGKTLLSFNNAIRFTSNYGTNMQVATTADNTWSAKKDYVANSADVVYSGYLRSSAGVPYEKWSRSAIDEDKTLQGILMDSYSSQYNQSWRMLSGDLFSNDTNFGPLNSLRETMDDNRIYLPVSIDWDAYANVYQVELLELFDIEVNGASGFSKGFTIGYNA